VKTHSATGPRPWAIGAGLLSLTALIARHWEEQAFFGVLAIMLGTSAGARWIEDRHPEVAGRALARCRAIPAWRWLGGGLGLWAAGWAIYHLSQDPQWVPSGIDWHDSYLDAYALKHGDHPLYCAWRYPLYPALGVWLGQLTGLDLSHALQLTSRLLAVGLAVPLFIIGRALYGRAAAVAGILALLTLATYRMHTDAVTPYPLVMLLAASGAAGLVCASRGRLWSWLAVGITSGALLATDGKSLLLALGFVGMGLPMALLLPWGDAPPRWVRPIPGKIGLRLARVALLLIPIALSHQWMGSLPVKAFTLEEMAVAYLIPGGRGAPDAPNNIKQGYMWGHLRSPMDIPRTLQTFHEAGQNPRMAEQNARQLRTSLQRMRMDYPGFSWRAPVVLGLCLLLPLARRRQTWPERLRTLLQIGAVGVVLLSCWPSIKSDYQERYVVHGAVLLPLLLMGGLSALARLLVYRDRPTMQPASGAAVLGSMAFLLLWTGNPISMGHLEDRLDPVAMGGLQEYEVGQWGRANLQEGDILLDSSWMMQGLLLSGEHTVARAANTYPPGGAPWPAQSWRFTRPWPDGRAPIERRYLALVNYLAMAPDTVHTDNVPIEELITGPDSPAGKKIAANSRWEEVYRTTDTIVRIYEWQGKTAPPGWQLHRRGP
jgi:hypothetical protein